MKSFHISDILSVTTGRLVSSRHIDRVYDILNFLTGDNLFTHQLPRAMKECEPWLRSQFPYLSPDNPPVAKLLKGMTDALAVLPGDKDVIAAFIHSVRHQARFPEVLPEMLPVYEMGADMHARIDPVTEAEAMMGKERVIVLNMPASEKT